MKPTIAITVFCLAAVTLFCGCDARVETPQPVVEKKETTIVNPPAEKTEKKVENNTTIVNPPAEKK